jgi:hypothetical protein
MSSANRDILTVSLPICIPFSQEYFQSRERSKYHEEARRLKDDNTES